MNNRVALAASMGLIRTVWMPCGVIGYMIASIYPNKQVRLDE